MTTVAQLAAQAYQEIGYVFFVEGWAIAWTNRVELAGSGVSSWIGTGQGARTVALGLEPPESVRLEIGMLESGLPINDALTFTLVDRDDHLIEFVEDEAGTLIGERLAPADDPAPATLIGAGGLNTTIRDRWLNGERIGSAGERRQFQVLPGDPLPGYDHASIDTESADLRVSTVVASARWMEGRPCALYLIRRDTAAGSWPSWSDQAASGYSRVWWGTIKSLSAHGPVWTLECEGPSSWLRRTLNANRPATWARLEPIVTFDEGEQYFGIALAYSTAAGSVQAAASSIYTASDVLTSGGTATLLAAEIDDRLNDPVTGLVVDTGPEINFASEHGGEASVTEEAISVRILNNNGGSAKAGVFVLRMHKKAWLKLGWDIVLQKRSSFSLATTVEVYGAAFKTAFETTWVGPFVDPAPGYWEAWFTTCPVGLDWPTSPGKVDGDGAERLYQPIYPGGVGLLYPEAKQVLGIGFGLNAPYLEGQLARPVADKTIDSGTCDQTGFIAIRGSFRDSLDADAVRRWQVAKTSWVKSSAGYTVGLDTEDRAVMWLEGFMHPEHFGVPNAKLNYTWAASDFEWAPIAVLGYNLNVPDAAHIVLLRLLLSSGTASWSGFEADPAATPTSGANAHADATNLADDREIADLGLCIPQEMIAWGRFTTAAEVLPGGKNGPLNKCKLGFVGPFDSQQLVQDLLAPRGWCFSLDGGLYGIFAKSDALDVEDVAVGITTSDIAGAADDLPPWETVDFRPLEPIDLIEVTFGGNQLDGGGGTKTEVIKARDPRAAQRRGNARVQIEGRTLLADGSAQDDFGRLWGDALARFYAEPHAMVTVRIKGDVARDLWPGTIVSYTSPWPATREGAYGMTARIGRVVSTELDTSTLAKSVTILVTGGDPQTPRRFAPIARLLDAITTVEQRHDAGARTLFCYRNAWSREGASSDVAGFVEPASSSIGGDAVANLWQSWDGLTWEKTATFEVESVNTTDSSITYRTGTLTGQVWERRFGIIVLAPYDDQTPATWPLARYGVICGVDGKFGAGNLDGFPWVE